MTPKQNQNTKNESFSKFQQHKLYVNYQAFHENICLVFIVFG